MKRTPEDTTMTESGKVGAYSDRVRVWCAAALACTGAFLTACSTTNSATDGGNGDDDGSPGTGSDSSADDGSSAAADSGGDDATVATGDDGATGSPEASADGSSGDADSGTSEAGPIYEGGLGDSCISNIFGQYVLRTDGVLIWEGASNGPETIVEASTGDPLKGIVNLEDAAYSSCAALSGGGVECWQLDPTYGNSRGQLGNGTTTASSTLYRATPVLTAAATPLTNVVAVASASAFGWSYLYNSNTACAVTNDGKLWCWGDLTWVVNGGTSLSSGYAQAITTDGTNALTGVSSAAVGLAQACVVMSGSPNTVRCWGNNTDGVLGQGNSNNLQYPTQATQVLGLTNPTKVVIATSGTDAFGAVTCVQDDANVRCWGDNANGAGGGNTTTNPILSPAAVVTQAGTLLGNVADIQAGAGDLAALKTDGTIWTWGRGFNNYAANYGLTNVLVIGWAGPANTAGPVYVTSDGVYHNAMTTVTVNCNAM